MESNIYGGRNSNTAERLRQIMEEKGVRQVDLAKATGIHKGRISGYLAGDCKPKMDRIAVLAKFFNVSEAWLMGFDAPKERSRSQKKNDQISDLVIRLQQDDTFLSTVLRLSELSEERLIAVATLLGLDQNLKDQIQ